MYPLMCVKLSLHVVRSVVCLELRLLWKAAVDNSYSEVLMQNSRTSSRYKHGPHGTETSAG